MDPRLRPISPERLRSIPKSFSWIDREILHQGFLARLEPEEISLYFFLALVAGPEGTSYWSHAAIAKLLKLPLDEVLAALRGLIRKNLVAFRYPTFQVLSVPERSKP
jgi:hypothetical protein